jgi:hypothetical protein
MLMHVPKRVNLDVLLLYLLEKISDCVRDWIQLALLYLRKLGVVLRNIYDSVPKTSQRWELSIHVLANECSPCIADDDPVRIGHGHDFEDKSLTELVGHPRPRNQEAD